MTLGSSINTPSINTRVLNIEPWNFTKCMNERCYITGNPKSGMWVTIHEKRGKETTEQEKKDEKILFLYFCTQKVKKKKRKIKTQNEEISWKVEVSHACNMEHLFYPKTWSYLFEGKVELYSLFITTWTLCCGLLTGCFLRFINSFLKTLNKKQCSKKRELPTSKWKTRAYMYM